MGTHVSTTVVKGSAGYMDPQMVNSEGKCTVYTDAFALGRTILVTLTGLSVTGVLSKCRMLIMKPTEPSKWTAPGVPDARAGEWPEAVKVKLACLMKDTSCQLFLEDRKPLPEVLEELESLCRDYGVGEAPCADVLAAERAARQPLSECVICMDAKREVRFACGHALCCRACLEALVLKVSECPTCKAPLTLGDDTPASTCRVETFQLPSARTRARAVAEYSEYSDS